MPKRSWRRQKSFPDAIGAGSRRRTLAITGALLVGAIVLGVQLGNSAIADIHPIHRGAANSPSAGRGAAGLERTARPREPTYASLHGWDGETCEGCAPVEPDIQIFSEAPPAYEAAEETLSDSARDVREPIIERKDVAGHDAPYPAEGEGD